MITSLKIKLLHQDAVMPAYKTAGSAAFDLQCMLQRCCENIMPGAPIKVKTGIAVEIPEGHVGIISVRSGKGINEGLKMSNQIGVVDSDFRGEITLGLWTDRPNGCRIEHGERIAQMMILPVAQVYLEEAEELTETSRGAGGLGSTGK